MSEFETLADLFPPDRQPTRELEPIQKVDRTDQIERDIEEFYETDSARQVLDETAEIVAGAGLSNRFRYVHATFGSGKSHLLKLIGVATGEIPGLEQSAHQLANSTSGFRAFREALADSHIDHLQPLFMNLLDRDRDDTTLPMMLFEELGRRRGYYTSKPWLLELCWRLDIEYDLLEQLDDHEHEGFHFEEIVDRPVSLRPWLKQAIPALDGAADANLGSEPLVEAELDRASQAVSSDSFGPYDLVERLRKTKRYLEQDGESYEFLIGLDEIAIYVGDQPRRYEEVVSTVEALIDGLNPPILGTGQWSMRDMQQDFVGEVDDEAWYSQEIELEGADTETIVRKRWLQKSEAGAKHIESELLADAPEIEPVLSDSDAASPHDEPAEAYPFRDRDLRLFRATMQGLIKGDRETDREYIQGRALLVRVRSLFDEHGWAERAPGTVVPWDVLYDVVKADTALIPNWAADLIDRVENTLDDELAIRTAKALFLLSQIDIVPRTAGNIARLLVHDVHVDLESLQDAVAAQLDALADANLIREDIESSPTTYTILSEEDIQFWQEVQQEATAMPEHQLQDNILQFLQDADPAQLPNENNTASGTFGDADDVAYLVRYTIDRALPESVTEQYDAIVVRLIADDADTLHEQRSRWQAMHSDPDGREDVLITVEITEAIRQQIRQLVGMQSVLTSMADPRPEYRLQRQSLQEDIEDTIRDQLQAGQVYTPTRQTAFGQYLTSFDEAVGNAVEKKFPNRKTIERPIQVEDLESMIEFFQGNAPWPLADTDAERLGVNRVPREINDGWAMEFLDVFSDEDRITGEQVLETIEGRRGAFLGTPQNALHALLFTLVADNRIEIRTDGERVTDTSQVARVITNRSGLRDAIIGFDPEPPAEDLTDVYEALIGDVPETDDTKVLLGGIADWAKRNTSHIRTVISRTNLEFETNIQLEALEDALAPAFAGDELDADHLTSPTVVDQALRYEKLAPLFSQSTDEEEPIWDRFDTTYDTLKELYPTATVTKQMQVYATGSQIPEADSLEGMLEDAQNHRVEQLQLLYQNLGGTEPTASDIGGLCGELTKLLQSESLLDDIETVETRYPAVTLNALRSLTEQADEDGGLLSEQTLAATTVRNDAETLAHGRALIEPDETGEPVLQRLEQMESELSESHDGFVLQQISRAVSGADIPDVGRADQLIEQAENLLEDDDAEDDDGDTDHLQQLWLELEEYDDGTIVVIDPEDNR